MVTPREIIRDYLTLLNILRDNKEATFEGIMSTITFKRVDQEETAPQNNLESTKDKPKINLFDIDI
jgi:hypothetical protein